MTNPSTTPTSHRTATRRHRDPAGFDLPVPLPWEAVGAVDTRTPLVALEPDDVGPRSVGFRANLVVTTGTTEGVGLDAWQRANDQLLDQRLKGWVLLDLERLQVRGHDGVRRLGTYLAPDGPPVTLEQWAFLQGDIGWTLSVTVANASWDTLADLVDEVGSGFGPAEERR